MAVCTWDPNKHGGKPCPVHGVGGADSDYKNGKKRITGGKHQISKDGKNWEDVDHERYNDLDIDEEEMDETTDEDITVKDELTYHFAVYDEDGESLSTFNTLEEAKKFAENNPEASSVSYVPEFDPDDNPDWVNQGEYEDFETVWEKDSENFDKDNSDIEILDNLDQYDDVEEVIREIRDAGINREDIKSIGYMPDNPDGFDGGFRVELKDGTTKNFGWYQGMYGVYPLDEDEDYNFDSPEYRAERIAESINEYLDDSDLQRVKKYCDKFEVDYDETINHIAQGIESGKDGTEAMEEVLDDMVSGAFNEDEERTKGSNQDSIIIYKVKNKAGEYTYYTTYKGQITKSSKQPPQGEETIKSMSFDDFDKLYEKGEVFFKKEEDEKPKEQKSAGMGKTGYQHGNWYIINGNGAWYIKDENSDWTYSGHFSTDKEAEDFIKNHEDEIKKERDGRKSSESDDDKKIYKNFINKYHNGDINQFIEYSKERANYWRKKGENDFAKRFEEDAEKALKLLG